MAGYNVGEADVTIVPNADHFNEDLAAKLLAAADAAGKEAGKSLDESISEGVRRGVEKARLELLGIGNPKVKPEFDDGPLERKSRESAKRIGTEFGTDFSNASSQSTSRLSPLIVGAVAGGLIAGGPAVIGAAGLLFGGIAAAAVHSNKQITDAFAQTGDQVTSTLKDAAQVTVPFFTSALQRLGVAAMNLGPQFHDAFAALAGPVDSLTTGLIGLVHNAMPGLVAAAQAATPVFQGLASFLSQVGQGLGDFFSIIAQHGAASGTVFAALGQAVGALLPILAQLVGAGAELGAQILPPIASVLGLVAKALNLVAPVLPMALAGFLAFKAVGAITPMLDGFAQKMAFASYSGGPMASMAGKASTAVSGLSSALPVVGAAVAVVGGAMAMASQQIQQWGQALLDGGRAADAATLAIQKQSDLLTKGASGFGSQVFGITGWADALGMGSAAAGKAKQAASDLYKAMSPLQQKQQDVTTATNNLQKVLADPHHTAAQAAAAAGKVAGAQAAQTGAQKALTDATNAALDPEARHRAALQGIATAASTAKTDTNLLKTALDALSGKTVDTVTAQIQLQDAIANATTATKGLKGSVVDANGHLNVYSAAGRAAGTALLQIRDSGNQLIATLEQQGASSARVSAADAKLRGSFIQTAEKMGFSAGQAKNLADQILGIPSSRNTRITADTANAAAAITGIVTKMSQLKDKTITIRTVTTFDNGSQTVHPGVGMTAGAIGGIVHAYAQGGIEPMSGGIAQIVPPNRLRVIGDRVTNDEAFIPINRDLRSQQIWMQAGQRMGMLGAAPAGGSSRSAQFTGNLYLDSGEFLGKVRGIAEGAVEDYATAVDHRSRY